MQLRRLIGLTTLVVATLESQNPLAAADVLYVKAGRLIFKGRVVTDQRTSSAR